MSEKGVNDVKVVLLDSDKKQLMTTYTRTDVSGNKGAYEFKNLPNGTYYVMVDLETIAILF